MAEILRTLYNEFDAYPAQWLRNLIAAGHLPDGTVDERSIVELQPQDCHETFHAFAGIGGWPLALRQAGWSGAVWTGSCPCQPFSVAGKRGGTDDPRHLWPEWFRLIRERRPVTIFGEQVASRDGLAWFDLVSADLEGCGYTVGAVVAPACGFGAPHIRQRLYFVAHSGRELGASWLSPIRTKRTDGLRQAGETLFLADASGGEVGPAGQPRERSAVGELGDTDERTGERNPRGILGAQAQVGGEDGAEHGHHLIGLADTGRGATNGFWADAEWLPCTDGKARATQPGLFPLAHGVPARVGRLRAYGNAVVVPQAAEFVRAYMEGCSDE